MHGPDERELERKHRRLAEDAALDAGTASMLDDNPRTALSVQFNPLQARNGITGKSRRSTFMPSPKRRFKQRSKHHR